MLSRLFSTSNTRIYRQSILWIELGILVVLAAGINLLLFAAAGAAPVAGAEGEAMQAQLRGMMAWPGALISAINMSSPSGVGALLVIILAGALITQEYHWRTLHLWLSRGAPRPVYALARFASLLLPVLLFVFAALLAGGLSSLFITLAVDGSLPLAQINAFQVILSVLRTAYTLLPYAALAFLLGVLTRSSVATIGIGVTFSLLIENLIGQLLVLLGAVKIVQYLPGSLAASLTLLNQAIAPAVEVAKKSAMPLLDPTTAAVGIALYTLVFLGLAIWKLSRQDLTAI